MTASLTVIKYSEKPSAKIEFYNKKIGKLSNEPLKIMSNKFMKLLKNIKKR